MLNNVTDVQTVQVLFHLFWEATQKLDQSYGKEIVAKARDFIPIIERLSSVKGATNATGTYGTMRQ